MYRHIHLITTLHGNISFSPQTVMSIHLGGIILYWIDGGGGPKERARTYFQKWIVLPFSLAPLKASLSGSLYDRHRKKSGLFKLYFSPCVVLSYLTFFFRFWTSLFFLLDGRYRYCNEVIPRFSFSLLNREDVVSSWNGPERCVQTDKEKTDTLGWRWLAGTPRKKREKKIKTEPIDWWTCSTSSFGVLFDNELLVRKKRKKKKREIV